MYKKNNETKLNKILILSKYQLSSPCIDTEVMQLFMSLLLYTHVTIGFSVLRLQIISNTKMI